MSDIAISDLDRYRDALHVVFTETGRVSIRDALRSEGISGRAISMPDCLGYGPIAPSNSPSRCEWLKREIGTRPKWPEQYDVLPIEMEEFWRDCDRSEKCVVWFSRRTVHEYSGFLEWIWRRKPGTYDVIDLTDAEFERQDGKRQLFVSLALVPPEQLRFEHLLSRAALLTKAEHDRYRALWEELREENAPLRIVDGDGIRSAPITYFDDLLMSHVRPQWTKVARVVGYTMVYGSPEGYMQVDDQFLGARVRSLVGQGRIEAQGNLFKIRYSEVRLPGEGDLEAD
jgi:hypothetical protein